MGVLDTLNIRRDEVFSVSLLAFQSFFLGAFLGAFDIGANTLFLNAFEQSMIPKAIVVSGLTGIVLTSIYSFLQARISFSKLASINLITVALLTFMLRAGYYFTDTKWLAFAMFVLMGPLNIIALVGFWGTVTRIFDLRQGKRIYGFIDSGQVIGVIISSFSVPFLINIGFHTINLLYISSVSIFIALVVQFFISAKYIDKINSIVVKEKKSSFGQTMRIPYVQTMAIFVVFSMLVAFFVHYLFLAVAGQRFENPDEMAKFFGGLMGSITFVSVLIKTFVYGTLMKTYGLKVSLLISPIVLTLVTVGAAFVGSIFGFTLESASFTFFFLLISLGKFFQKALKDSIESPVLKLIYQSLDPNIRYEVQARVDGTINEFAALASGVILTILSLIGFITLIHYIYFLIGIIFIWFIISFRLFYGYRRTLQETLEKAAIRDKKEVHKSTWQSIMDNADLRTKIALAHKTKPWLVPQILKSNLPYCSNNELALVCQEIENIAEVSTLPLLKQRLTTINGEDKEIAVATIEYLENLILEGKSIARIKELMNSKEHSDRAYAAKCIWASGSAEAKQQLTFLYRDLVPSVKRQAIWASRGSKSKETINFLVDFLDKEQYAPLAHTALIDSGEIGLELLEMGFNRTNVSNDFRIRTLRIIPETGSVIAERALFDKLSLLSPFRDTILNGLLSTGFAADDRDHMKVHRLLTEQAGICAWNLNALYHCPSGEAYEMLRVEVDGEFHRSRFVLFSLLKLIYTKSSIDAVIENLETGTGESISFAIELLDTFIDEDIKPYIIPLLEATSITNRIWALQNYFPLKTYSPEDLLKALLNRNQNLISKQTKILALTVFNKISNLNLSADLIAQLFNTDRVLRELSALVIQKIDGQGLSNLKRRIGGKQKIELDRALQNAIETNRNSFERYTFFLNSNFNDTKEESLFWLYHSAQIALSNTNLLALGLFRGKKHYLLIEKGSIEAMKGTDRISVFSPGDIVSTASFNDEDLSLVTGSDTLFHFMDEEVVTSRIYDSDYLTKYVFTEKYKLTKLINSGL